MEILLGYGAPPILVAIEHERQRVYDVPAPAVDRSEHIVAAQKRPRQHGAPRPVSAAIQGGGGTVDIWRLESDIGVSGEGRHPGEAGQAVHSLVGFQLFIEIYTNVDR